MQIWKGVLKKYWIILVNSEYQIDTTVFENTDNILKKTLVLFQQL
jgi:hypothetical protein